MYGSLTVAGGCELPIWRIGAFLVYLLSTNLRLDGNVVKVKDVGLRRKWIILPWSTEIVGVEVGTFKNRDLNFVEAGVVGFLASGVSARTVAGVKFGKAVLVVRIEVRSSL